MYTPMEVVDFIIHSVEDVMRKEFNSSLANENVHIIDPFTGTGTFITRLLQSGIIPADKLPYKFKNEIHANEIVLLAYYIAAINIEATYHGILSGNVTGKEDEDDITDVPYVPFEGICLTDTFQMYESEDLVDQLLEENSERRKRQKSLDIRVIIGNPPYSAGQSSANDNNANIAYPELDERIRTTYAERSKAVLKNALYDSYIRAIRWASDRIGDQGVIGFVTNGGFLEANTADGMRQCLVEEFSSLYVFHLRGNGRTSGELCRREGQPLFAAHGGRGGSLTPIAISILVKNPDAEEHGKIFFHDIGDYLTRAEKLERISQFGSIEGIAKWKTITPDGHGDWLSQRDDSFEQYMSLGEKRDKGAVTIFDNYSNGVKTNRDAWVYNSSQVKIVNNVQRMITNYNVELSRFNEAHQGLDRKSRQAAVDGFIDNDATKISWTVNLKSNLVRGSKIKFEERDLFPSVYRPFTKQWLYFNRDLVERMLQMPRIFPTAEAENLVIQVSGMGAKEPSVLISNVVTDLQVQFNGQCFPLYLYEEAPKLSETDLFNDATVETGLVRCDAITDEGLAHFQEAYPNQTISKEDLFYYVYGILHSEDYRSRFAKRKHGDAVADNLLNQNFNPTGLNEDWAGDVTYCRTAEGWMYLAVVMDLYSRRIVGWHMDKRMTTDLVCKALSKAYNIRRPPAGLVFHSDRGSQYTSKRFRKLLRSYNMRASMGDVGACWDNAVVERFFGSLKHDWLYKVPQPTHEHMKADVAAYMRYYNLERLHTANGDMSPVDYENTLRKVSGFS